MSAITRTLDTGSISHEARFQAVSSSNHRSHNLVELDWQRQK